MSALLNKAPETWYIVWEITSGCQSRILSEAGNLGRGRGTTVLNSGKLRMNGLDSDKRMNQREPMDTLSKEEMRTKEGVCICRYRYRLLRSCGLYIVST